MKKVLVVRFSSLGDVILCTPVFRNLKNSDPGLFVTAAVKEKYAAILESNPHVDRVLSLKEGESLWSFIRRVRSEKFDVLIDLHNNVRSNLLSVFSGIPKKVRYRKAALERRLFVRKRVQSPELRKNVIDRYLETLELLGIKPGFTAPEIYPAGKNLAPAPFRILIVQTAFLGDAVLTTPMFEAIRKVYPQSKISVLCTPEIKDIFSGNKDVNEVLVMDKRGKEGGLYSLWRWGKELRDRYDVAILPHRSFRSALLAWLAGIPKRVGFDTSQGKIFLTETVHFDWKTHDAERNMRLLEALGIRGSRPELTLPFGNSDFSEDLLGRYGIDKGSLLVGMNPGSVWNTKRWLAGGFAEVADTLIRERKCNVVLFGSERDLEAVNAVEKNMKNKPVNLCGKTGLKSLAYLISRCSLFVTNDSGPMHLASAAGVPVVAIFGPTTRELGFFPYGARSVVVELDLSCRPCTLHGGDRCPLGHFKCMKELTPEMVLNPCREFLDGAPGTKK